MHSTTGGGISGFRLAQPLEKATGVYNDAQMIGDAQDITLLLKAWSDGDSTAQEKLIVLIYKELRHLARRYRRRSGAGDTLQTTASPVWPNWMPGVRGSLSCECSAD